MVRIACGIDIGGSGVKGAVVDLDSGELTSQIVKVATPQPATPEAVSLACKQLLADLSVGEDIPVGVSFPAPVKHGSIPFMANLDQAWVGLNIADVMGEFMKHKVVVLNDADSAALGEAYYGAAAGVAGEVIVITLGTGIGSGMVVEGRLVPNTELGHLELDGHDAEKRAAARIKTEENLGWEEYIERLQRYLSHVEMLFSPDLFVVGGGISENHEMFLPKLKLRARIVPATLKNTAGFIGAAWAAWDATK